MTDKPNDAFPALRRRNSYEMALCDMMAGESAVYHDTLLVSPEQNKLVEGDPLYQNTKLWPEPPKNENVSSNMNGNHYLKDNESDESNIVADVRKTCEYNHSDSDDTDVHVAMEMNPIYSHESRDALASGPRRVSELYGKIQRSSKKGTVIDETFDLSGAYDDVVLDSDIALDMNDNQRGSQSDNTDGRPKHLNNTTCSIIKMFEQNLNEEALPSPGVIIAREDSDFSGLATPHIEEHQDKCLEYDKQDNFLDYGSLDGIYDDVPDEPMRDSDSGLVYLELREPICNNNGTHGTERLLVTSDDQDQAASEDEILSAIAGRSQSDGAIQNRLLTDAGHMSDTANAMDMLYEDTHHMDGSEPVYFLYDIEARSKCEGEETFDDHEVYEPVRLGSTAIESEDEQGWGSDEFEEYSNEEIDEVIGEDLNEYTQRSELEDNKQKDELVPVYENLPEARKRTKPDQQGFFGNIIGRTLSVLRKPDQETMNKEHASGYIEVTLSSKKHPPPELPPQPDDLSPLQLKRRYIVTSVIDSEKSYVDSLHRIVKLYEEPLRENGLLSFEKIETVFGNIRPIIESHKMFQIALADCVAHWDAAEQIGGVFASHFDKGMVFEVYSAYVINFTNAMDSIRDLAKSKSAFSDFLKNQIAKSADKLSLFGLMVKPVQRFPQFILLIQDLLKNTDADHHDRLDLQVAITVLENLAHKLNERKRNAEQKHAVKQILQNMKILRRGVIAEVCYLVRQDVVKQIEYNPQGGVSKKKTRKLFIFNNLLICANIYERESDTGSQERYTVKWSLPFSDVQLEDRFITPNMGFSLASRLGNTTISRKMSDSVADYEKVSEIRKQLDGLLHDFSVLSQISQLISTLHNSYQGLSEELTDTVKKDLQKRIQLKDEQMRMIDSCTVQLILPDNWGQLSNKLRTEENKLSKTAKRLSLSHRTGSLKCFFRFNTAAEKQGWVVDFKMAQLSADDKNNPSWYIPETEKDLYQRPQFIRDIQLDITKNYTKLNWALPVFLPTSEDSDVRIKHLWTCSGLADRGQVTIISLHSNIPRVVESFQAYHTAILSAVYVPNTGPGSNVYSHDAVWMATSDRRIIVHRIAYAKRKDALTSFETPALAMSMLYVSGTIAVSFDNGSVAIYRPNINGDWQTKSPNLMKLGDRPVGCMLCIADSIWCACNNTISVINPATGAIQAHHEMSDGSLIQCMVQAGVGLWVAYEGKSVIQLYHIESMMHIQDQNVQSAVVRTFTDFKEQSVAVTCMLVSQGLLWVGTDVGVILTLNLPRLEGVPLVSGRPMVSCHAQKGPIKFLMSVCSEISFHEQACEENTEKTQSINEPTVSIDRTVSFDLDRDKTKPAPTRSISGIYQGSWDPDRHIGGDLASARWKFVSTPNLLAIDNEDDISNLYSSLMKGPDADYENEFISSLKDQDHHTGHITFQTTKADVIQYRKRRQKQRQKKAYSVAAVEQSPYEPVEIVRQARSTVEPDDRKSLTVQRSVKRPKTVKPMSVTIVCGGNGHVNRNDSTEYHRRGEDPRLLLWLAKTV